MLSDATSAQVPHLRFFFSINSIHNRRGLDSGELLSERVILVHF